MLAGAHDAALRSALEALAGVVMLDGFGKVVQSLQLEPERLQKALELGHDALAAAQARVLGAEADTDAVLQDAVNPPRKDELRRVLRAVAENGAPSLKPKMLYWLDWLALQPDDRAAKWEKYSRPFSTKEGSPIAATGLVNAVLDKKQPDLLPVMLAEQARVMAVEEKFRAARVAAFSAALLRLAAPAVRNYAATKEQTSQLDYQDLIQRTMGLLIDPGAAWVLYKLDGGLDHLLLDEVQDTAPAQWSIAGQLTQEFFAGQGAAEVVRTVFAVGDQKQSIYSFQGADPHAFDLWRGVLRDRVQAAGEIWHDVALDVSFRSTDPVLRLVDAVFQDPIAAAGVAPAGTLAHQVDRAGHAGRVELWPLVPVPVKPASAPWTVPESNLVQTSAVQRLADALAEWIAIQTNGQVPLESRGRTLVPGDVLVLVRSRNEFGRALVRALKSRAVPVAGLDRLVLTQQPAVADLLALCDTLLLPDDDLALACVLTSPLGGLSDDSLMRLATGRSGSLWAALTACAAEAEDWRTAKDRLAALMQRVDYTPPHALLTEVLGPMGGRARLLARLGPEAAEPIDELLNAALTYAQTHPPSLQGFVQWLRQAAAEVKREADGAGGAVRIMTVHGAKGLQAPLVILPDTTAMPPEDSGVIWAEDADTGLSVPIWSPNKELRCETVKTLMAQAATARIEEYNRLLYVALTRAEDRLLICGWATTRARSDACWYDSVQRGMARLPAHKAPFDAVADPWDGTMAVFQSQQTEDSEKQSAVVAAGPVQALPAWAGQAPDWHATSPAAEPALPSPLAPSRPENVALGDVPQADSPLLGRDVAGRRFRRGSLVHALLQYLPDLPPAARATAARRYLAQPGHDLSAAAAAALADEVLAVLDHPDLAPLFAPGSLAEVPLTGVVAGSVIGGMVDRIAVLEGRVLLVDYKTNRTPPAHVGVTPVLYLRQMAAYRAVLRAAFPGRDVVCALVWTQAARVDVLADALLESHAPGRVVQSV